MLLLGNAKAYTLGGMCRRVQCRKCGKPSWAGCGAHVEQVLGNVPKAERCQCGDNPVTAKAPSAAVAGGFWSRLLSKR